jgi:hypothetical protein
MPRIILIALVLGLLLVALVGALADVVRGRRPALLGRPVLATA